MWISPYVINLFGNVESILYFACTFGLIVGFGFVGIVDYLFLRVSCPRKELGFDYEYFWYFLKDNGFCLCEGRVISFSLNYFL